MALHVEVLDEVAAQLDRALGERLGDAGLARAVMVHQALVEHRRIAQPEGVVERPAVPVGGPLAAEVVDQRVVEAGRPAQLARFLGLARLLLELAVHLGQHQEQRVLLLGALGRRGADRLVDPRRHHVREVADLLVAVGDAEQDGRELALGRVALEEIGDLAAQQQLAQRVGALGDALGLGDVLEVGELQARAGAGEVEQVGMVEEIPRLLGDRDRRARRSARRPASAAGGRPAGLRRSACLGRTSSVSAASAPSLSSVSTSMMLFSRGISASMPSSASGAKASFSQALVERQIEIGEGLEVVPQHRPQPGAVAARQARRQLDRLAPVLGAQLGRDAGEEGVEILDQVEHVVGIEIARRLGQHLGAQLGQALADRRAVRPLERRLLVVEVEQEGIAEDLDDVGLGRAAAPAPGSRA